VISGFRGEVLHIRHEEAPSRLIVKNDMQNLRLANRDKLQSYRVKPTGLEHIPQINVECTAGGGNCCIGYDS
jgi:carbohydrate-binding protein (putative mucin)